MSRRETVRPTAPGGAYHRRRRRTTAPAGSGSLWSSRLAFREPADLTEFVCEGHEFAEPDM
jgi:hypothetical protein